MAIMKKEKVAYRKANENRVSIIVVMLVVLMLIFAVLMRSVEMRHRLAGYMEQEAKLQEQIDAERVRESEIEEFRKYTQTKSYMEEVAREKLGLMYEGEILFQQGDR